MTAYAALLRGINVGGRHKVPMARLRELAGELGYRDVATYVQSGNLLLSTSDSAAAVERELAAALEREFGFDVPVIVRTRQQLATVLERDELADVADDDAKRAVTFLSGKPKPAQVKALDPDEFLPERFSVVGSELIMWCPDGLGRSKLAAAPWGRRLGVTGTTRNWRTVRTLHDMFADAAG